MSFIAYRVTRIETGKSYIGITAGRLSERWRLHKQAKQRHGLAGAIRRYGVDAFRIDHIASARSREELRELEITLIAQEGTLVPAGYNLTGGGEGQLLASAETRERMSRSRRALGRALSPEHKAKVGSIWRGKRIPDATRAALLAANLGKPKSDTARRKIGDANRGRIASEEVRAKLSAIHKGRKKTAMQIEATAAAHRGSKRSPETCRRISEALKNSSKHAANLRALAVRKHAEALERHGQGALV